MMRLFSYAAVVAAISLSTLSAQPPGPGPRGHVEGLAKRLSLTDDQKTRATAIYDASRKTSTAMHATMRQAHEALKAAVQKNDTVAIDQASLQIGTLMAKQMSAESKADAAFRQTLTADQQAKFDRMMSRGGGFGRPGGPPPAPDGNARPEHVRHAPPPPAAQ